ncbi:MAG: SdrD B-like domain-containing protein [archaeon]
MKLRYLCAMVMLLWIAFFNGNSKAEPTGSIGDWVWLDEDKDGWQDPKEKTGIQGVTVKLFACNSTTVLQTTTTDADGKYEFSGLSTPGDYYVQFVLPSGYTFSPKDAHANDDPNDSDADPSTGITACYHITGAEPEKNVDAGMYLTSSSSLGDKVWNDVNKNGIQDAGEAGIENVTVDLYACNGNSALQTTTTDASGLYNFYITQSGSYKIVVHIPTGYAVSPQNAGSPNNDNTDSDINSSGVSDCVTLSAGDNITSLDAGMYKVTSSLGDLVWNDLNHNGIQDAGEPGMAGITVELHGCNAPTTAAYQTTTTDATGHYLFTNLPSDLYYIVVIVPNGYAATLKMAGSDTTKDSNLNSGGPGAVGSNCVALPVDYSNLAMDAGLYSTAASLGDLVWNDLNHNGIQESGEPGIAGVTVELFSCNNIPTMTVMASALQSTVTDANGKYLFSNLSPGSYYVKVTPLTGYAITTRDAGSNDAIDSDIDPATGQTSCITLSAGESNLTVDAGLYGNTGCIGDFVWLDLNKNGIQDMFEPGIPKIKVTLYNCTNNCAIATEMTDISGHYAFKNVPAGSYYVKFTVPSGYEVSPALQGGNINKDSNPDETGKTACFNLAAGESNLSIDAGMYPKLLTLACLGDYVWCDLNKDGIQNLNEKGIPNVTVNLFACNGALLKTTVTNIFGKYDFIGIPAGSYYVQFVLPQGYVFSPMNAGNNDAIDSDADPNNAGKTTCITLAEGEINKTVDCGMYKTTPPPPQLTASLGDFVWNDVNKNGIQDAGETGIPDVTVQLYKCADNSLVATTKTNTNGLYIFDDLNAGQYYVKFAVPAGYTVSPALQGGDYTKDSDPDATGKTACITLSAGTINFTIDAGMYVTPVKPASIGDFVWKDCNNNGIQDTGEPGIPGVKVKLYTCAGVEKAVTTTDANGKYIFTNLAPASYYVLFVLPEGYAFSPRAQGNDADKDSNPDETGKTICYTLVAGENNMSIDAGLYPIPPACASIGDFVWKDCDHNGIQNEGEEGIPDVTVELYKCENNCLVASVKTDANGRYHFTGLTPGIAYHVKFILPECYMFSPKDNAGNDAIDSDADPSTGMTGSYTLAPGENNMTVDAGMYPRSSVAAKTAFMRDNSRPEEFGLMQNYPNPFNPTTTIEFAIKDAGYYTVKVYNMLGQEITTLFSGNLSVGVHGVIFNAEGLPSGIYIYRLAGNNVQMMKKMILSK